MAEREMFIRSIVLHQLVLSRCSLLADFCLSWFCLMPRQSGISAILSMAVRSDRPSLRDWHQKCMCYSVLLHWALRPFCSEHWHQI